MRNTILSGLLVISLATWAIADTPETPEAATAPSVAAEITAPTKALNRAGRPQPQENHRLASGFNEVGTVEGQTEGEAYLAALDPELREELFKKGQVLMSEDQTTNESYAGYIRALAIFRNSKERSYELIVEPTMQPEYLPRLVSASALEEPAQGELTHFHLRVMLNNIRFHVRHWFYPEISRVEWHLDKDHDNDIRDQEGYWQLFAVNDELTVGEYGTRVDTGIAVPRRIQDFFARRDIPTALEAFRAYIDSDGEYRR